MKTADPPAHLRIGVAGSPADVRDIAALLDGRFIAEAYDSDQTGLSAVVVCLDAEGNPILPLRDPRLPVVVSSRAMNVATVEYATRVGALDVVLHSDGVHLRAAIERASSLLAPLDRGAIDSAALREELTFKLLDLTPNYVSVRDQSGRLVLVSQSFADFRGTTVEAMIGEAIGTFTTSAAEVEAELKEDAEIARTRRSRVVERDVVDPSGAVRRLHIIKRPLALDDGRSVLVMMVATDVTRRYRMERALERANDFLENVLETITEAVFALDENGYFTFVNRRVMELTGFRQHDLLGSPFAGIFSDASLLEARRHLAAAIGEHGKEQHFEAELASADGDTRIVACSLVPLLDGEGQRGAVGTAEDVTDRRAFERQIEHLAYHDPLTNLPNRRLLSDRLQVAMSQSLRDGRKIAVIFLDLDRFKNINDSLGHRAGDTLLQELSARLRMCVRAGDTVARMGGDEFVFVLPGITDESDAIGVANKILEAVREPFIIDDRAFIVTACLGISLAPDHAADADMLIKQADLALFESKHRGRDAWRIFEPSMDARSIEYLLLESDLRRAIAASELRLYYQPIIDMETGRLHAFEALVRWQHPERGLLLPDEFIPLAEESGIISALGEWVLREACRRCADWQTRGILRAPVAVNLSAHQFDASIGTLVREALESSGLAPEFLELELTESTLMQSISSSTQSIAQLKELGVRLSIDDFGTGYSSLSYLERFPIAAIKIDRMFLPHESGHRESGVIASAIISLAQSLQIEVVAEGVETIAQRDFLIARGCRRGQGFFFSVPLEADDVERLAGRDAGHRAFAQHAFEYFPAGSAR